jgi:hypothetical protein
VAHCACCHSKQQQQERQVAAVQLVATHAAREMHGYKVMASTHVNCGSSNSLLCSSTNSSTTICNVKLEQLCHAFLFSRRF